jgi:hypothetical protein
MRSLVIALATVSLIGGVAAQGTSTGGTESEPPLELPVLGAHDSCPASIGSRWDSQPDYVFGGPMWFGGGPVSMAFTWGQRGDRAGLSLTSIPVEHGRQRAKTPWISEPSYSGPVEIRGRSLRANRTALLFSRDMTAPPIERLHLQAPSAPKDGLYSFWASSMFVPGPGCYGIQIDTTAHRQVVIFEAK